MSTDQSTTATSAPAAHPASPAPSAIDAGGNSLAGFFPPAYIVAQLSQVRTTQPVAALASVNQHRDDLTEVFLQAVERALQNPAGDFAEHGMLFNYATYFLAKWREPRACPLFLRWFSLPGEDALELGGDTVTLHGGRFLASVCGREVEPLKALIVNQSANTICRSQALVALAVLVGWNELPREILENHLLWLAREGLERQPISVWNMVAAVSVQLEFLSVFPEVRRACTEGLVPPAVIDPKQLDALEKAPPGEMIQAFIQQHPPIVDVIEETRNWAGFQPKQPRLSQPYVAQSRVGRNETCPCGSGKKYKKCCGR